LAEFTTSEIPSTKQSTTVHVESSGPEETRVSSTNACNCNATIDGDVRIDPNNTVAECI
jgi:hypothetical protein